MILVTTSDYFPKLGGLSTFTLNIEKTLRELGLEYELFCWSNYRDIYKKNHDLSKYSLIINIHPQFAWISKTNHERMINFIHGSEILMTSPSLIKKLYKKIKSREYFYKLSHAYLNFFISEATMNKAVATGFTVDYSRDVILHNCIDTSKAQFVEKQLKDKIVFSCIVRNVPHKNLAGAVKFCELVAKVTSKEVELVIPQGTELSSSKIIIKELKGNANIERDEAFRNSHYNLLLSLDQSSKGYFEGFGLTVLEAACFGTPSIVCNSGGLSESVHNEKTGWVINDISEEEITRIFTSDCYDIMARECFDHTITSHSLSVYKKIFEQVLIQRGAA